VRKHSGNIHFKNSTSTLLSQNVIQYYITKRREIWNTMRYTRMNSTKGPSQVTKGKIESRARRLEEKDSGWSIGNPRFHYAFWSASEGIHKLQTLKSGHAGSGLSEATQRVVRWVSSGMHKQTKVYMIKWCDLDIQVQALTRDMKENQEISGKNLESS